MIFDYILHQWKSLACILIAALYLATKIYVWYRLRHIPGPLSAGFSKWWLIRSHASGRTHLDLAVVTEKFGTLTHQKAEHELTEKRETCPHRPKCIGYV